MDQFSQFFTIKFRKDLWRKIELKLTDTSQICCRTALRKVNVQLNCFTLMLIRTISSMPRDVIPAECVRNLGIYIDADLMMRTHVQRTVSRCFAALRQLRQIRQLVPRDTLQMLVVALVHSCLDYGNSTFAGIPISHAVSTECSCKTHLPTEVF